MINPLKLVTMEKKLTLGNVANAVIIICGFVWTAAQRDRDLTSLASAGESRDRRISSLEGKVEVLQLFNARLEPDIAYIKQTLNEVKTDVKVINSKTPPVSSSGE